MLSQLFEVGLDGEIYHYQSRRDDLLIHSPAEFIGKKVQELLPPEVANVIFDAIKEASIKGWSTGHQYSLYLAQGKYWFENVFFQIFGTGFHVTQDLESMMILRMMNRRYRPLTSSVCGSHSPKR